MERSSKNFVTLAILLFIFYIISFADQLKVTRVTDVDTIKVVRNGTEMTIRLVGIDAFETSKKKKEPGQPFSQKFTKYLTGLVSDKSVDIKPYGQDRYGRTFGVVFVNGTNVNLEMIKAALAEVYRGPPAKDFDLDPYWKAEKEAREAKLNMWSLGDKYISPREWRRMQN